MVSLLLATESGLGEPRRLLTGQSPYLRHLWPPVKLLAVKKTSKPEYLGHAGSVREHAPVGAGCRWVWFRVFQGFQLDHSSLFARRFQYSFGPWLPFRL